MQGQPLLVNNLRTIVRISAWLVAAAWAYKAISASRGLRNVPDLLAPAFDRSPVNSPTITVVVPACNEEASIAACLHSLLEQDYPCLHITAIDDRSTDTTGAVLDALAHAYPRQLTVLHVVSLPLGWLGKTHAMALAARHSEAAGHPDWLLFTDADVVFHPEAIRRSLAQAVAQQADHFITIPTALVRSFGEGVMLGFLQVIGLWATRLWRVGNPRSRDAMGIGAFNLIQTPVYLQLGGFEATPMAVVEDLTLGRRVKQAGLRQRVAFAFGYVNVHWAPGALGIINTMTKNLFAIFHFSAALLLITCIGFTCFCIAPFAALGFTLVRTPALLTSLAIASLFRTSSRYSGIPAWYGPTFPFAAVLFIYSLLRSMTVTLWHRGIRWRGTFYPLAELRKGSLRLSS